MFVGLSAPGILSGEDIAAMAEGAVVFALANPDPEVDPEAAGEHAAVVATGASRVRARRDLTAEGAEGAERKRSKGGRKGEKR